MAEESQYFAVIGDLVGSRQALDRAAVQEKLGVTLDLLNDVFAEHIQSRFVITVGDEFQGLLYEEAPLDRIWWRFAGEMFPAIPTRFGFGLGEISTPLRDEALGMDGPGFWLAREAIELAHDQNLLWAFGIPEAEKAAAINDAGRLLNQVMADWTESQWETVTLFERLGNQIHVAEARGVVRQTVNTSLSRSHGPECLQSFRGLLALAKRV